MDGEEVLQDVGVVADGGGDGGRGGRWCDGRQALGPGVPGGAAVAVVAGAGFLVAQDHGRDEQVPGQLQGEVGADQQVLAGGLERGEDGVEAEAGGDAGQPRGFGQRVHGGVRGADREVDTAQVRQDQAHSGLLPVRAAA
ncbi:hypothetical protein ACIQVZ_41090, partial [Kitasatospora sp. NPDC098663]